MCIRLKRKNRNISTDDAITQLKDILQKENDRDREIVVNYEKMYRDCKDGFYKKSYKRSIDMANARRTTRKDVLHTLKELGL